MTENDRPEDTYGASECIRAGMYWFGRSDFEAARAWWTRALEIDPTNQRAQECLRLLTKTSSIGFTDDLANPFAAEPSQPSVPDHRGIARPSWSKAPVNDPSDAFAFAIQSQNTPLPVSVDASGPSAWDDGPSRTSAVTLDPQSSFDAVADATPLPTLDRDEFFGRSAPESKEEIVSYLQATGDLPVDPPPMADEDSGEVEWPQEFAVQEEVIEESASDAPIVFDSPVELSAEPAPAEVPVDPMAAARNRFALHDFGGVLEILDSLEEAERTEETRNLQAEARRNLMRMCESKIGDFEHHPRVLISDDEMIWLDLDHRAGFILSQVDGMVSYEDLISLSGMPRLDTLQILGDLIDKKVVG